ncbi:hypothetical protein J6590_101730, partial [Homalodisca vitripennis]
AKKPPLTLNLGSNGLKDDFRTTTNGRADGLLARTGSLSGHPTQQQPQSTYLAITAVPTAMRHWHSIVLCYTSVRIR